MVCLPKVNEFLESISRNSIKSKKSYSSVITLLQDFLDYKNHRQEQQTQNQGNVLNKDYNCQTIFQALTEK